MPFVDSTGVGIYYEIAGEGTPILLVHGFLSSFDGHWGQSGWVDFLVAQRPIGVDQVRLSEGERPQPPPPRCEPLDLLM